MTVFLEIVELPGFRRAADRLLSEDERLDLFTHLALNPEAGAILRGTGGVRKIRWAIGTKGKSGGVRAIYYFQDQSFPILMLTVYAKADQSNLNAADKRGLQEFVTALKSRRET